MRYITSYLSAMNRGTITPGIFLIRLCGRLCALPVTKEAALKIFTFDEDAPDYELGYALEILERR